MVTKKSKLALAAVIITENDAQYGSVALVVRLLGSVDRDTRCRFQGPPDDRVRACLHDRRHEPATSNQVELPQQLVGDARRFGVDVCQDIPKRPALLDIEDMVDVHRRQVNHSDAAVRLGQSMISLRTSTGRISAATMQ